jgi:Flp pilus assembly pilin Flp
VQTKGFDMTDALRSLVSRLQRDQRGLTTVEYTIVLCLIAALCVGVWKTFGSDVKGYITSATGKIDSNVQEGLKE